MFALGLVCWLFNRNLAAAEKMLREKFAKKPEIAEANIKVLNDGFNYGATSYVLRLLLIRLKAKLRNQKDFIQISTVIKQPLTD